VTGGGLGRTGFPVRESQHEQESSDWYAQRYKALREKTETTEADISDALVRPVLEQVLGFDIAEIDAQPTDTDRLGVRRRPDFACRRASAAVIVEVKNFGTDLTTRTGKSWKTAPLGQLESYLLRYRRSADGTYGIVTNGDDWLVTRRVGERVLPFKETAQASVRELADVQRLLDDVIHGIQQAKSGRPAAMSRRTRSSRDSVNLWMRCGSGTAAAWARAR